MILCDLYLLPKMLNGINSHINGRGEILPQTPLNHTRQHNCHQVSELYLSGYILARFGGNNIETVGFMRHFQRSLKIRR